MIIALCFYKSRHHIGGRHTIRKKKYYKLYIPVQRKCFPVLLLSIMINKAVWDKKLVFKEWLKTFSPEIFEVDFSDVISGRGPKIYLEPEEFFANTFLTGRMKEVLGWCLARTAGKSLKGIIHLATGFGGGKSHLLTLLYHTFKCRKAIDLHILEELGLERIPDVEVVAVDGHNLAYPMMNSPSLGRYLRPTKDETIKALEAAGKPIVFLIDELVVYFAKLDPQKLGEETGHLHTLIESVKSTQNCVLVITTPKGSGVYGKEAEQIDSLIRETKKADAETSLVTLAGRISEPVVPVEAGDFISIVKKRLVEFIDPNTAQAVEQYMGRLVPGINFSGYYPFHPLLIDLLYSRVSTFIGFQKTRDSLKVVALAIKGLLNNLSEAEFYVISPAEMPLFDLDLKAILTNERVFGYSLEQAVTKDAVENSRKMDGGRRAYGKNARAASTVFMYSLHPEHIKRGATPGDVYRCMVPEVKSEEDAKGLLETFYKNSDFMWHEGGRYLFKPKQNVANMIRQKAALVNTAEVEMCISNELYSTVFADTDEVAFHKDLASYSPEADKVNAFVVLPGTDDRPARSIVLSITGSRKNTAVILVPKEDLKGKLIDDVKLLIGAKRVLKEVKNDKELYLEAQKFHNAYESEALQDLRMMYSGVEWLKGTSIFRPVENLRPEGGVTIANALLRLMRKNEKIAELKNIDPEIYVTALIGIRESVTVRDLFDDIETITNVPFAFRNDLKAILSEAVYQGIIGAVEGSLPEGPLPSNLRVHIRDRYNVQDGDTIVRPEKAEAILRELYRPRGEAEKDNEGTAIPFIPTTDKQPRHVQPIPQSEGSSGMEVETIVADITELYQKYSEKEGELMMGGKEYTVEVSFTGAISGRLTAKSGEEMNAIKELVQALSKAAVIIPSAKATVIFRYKE